MNRFAKKLGFVFALALLCGLSAVRADDAFSNRPIKIYVGFAAGGPGNLPTRFLAERLGAALSTPVIIENKPGASSMLAVDALLAQPRDGHTLLLCTHYDAVNTVLYKSVRFQLKDFAPVSLISKYYQVVGVSNNLPVNTIKEFVAYAKANPNKLNYGTLGPGSPQELAARELSKISGIQMTGITFRGAAPAMTELMAGRIDLYVGPPLTLMPLYKAQKIKVLGVTAPERFASEPDIPTLTENGFPIVQSGFLAICAGAGTPQPLVERLNKEIRTIVETDDFRVFVEKTGSVAVSTTPEGLRNYMSDTAKTAGALIREFKMQID